MDLAFWAAAAVITLGVAGTLVRAMMKAGAEVRSAAEFDLAVYRDQLAEIDRDVSRGTLPKDEAARLRTEVSRRLLEADRAAAAVGPAGKAGAGFGVMALVLVVIAGASAVYFRVGAPGYPDLPLSERFAMSEELRNNRMSQAEAEAQTTLPPPRTDVDASFLELMDKLRQTMAERPDDLRGLELLARNEAALGNLSAAMAAQSGVIRVKGADATAEDHAALAEIMILAAGGFVSPEAEEVLVKALETDPKNGTARYYSGVMFAQVGRFDRTFVLWRSLLEEGPADAPWIAPIRSQMAEIAARAGVNYTLPEEQRLAGPSSEDVAAAQNMTAEDRQAMIEGMVAQLGERLASEGGSAEEWARLISSLAILGRMDEAKEIYAEAQKRFEGASVDLQGIRQAAVNAGIAE